MTRSSVSKAVLASLVTAAAVLAAAAPSAAASSAGTCSLYVPSRVSIGQPYRAITVRLGPNCAAAGVVEAAWTAYHPTQGLQAILYYDGTSTEVWDLYEFDAIGRWQWRPEGAYDADLTEVSQYGPYSTDVRLASYGRVTATRSGSRVTVRTTAARYWSDGGRFIGWAGARGQIQWRTPGTTTWRGLKEVYSSPTGTYSYTYSTSQSREYRVVLYDNTVKTIWGSTSPTVRR
ncbi:MAG: hypothetical protein ACRCZD_08135 [Phycicoccus sp.]